MATKNDIKVILKLIRNLTLHWRLYFANFLLGSFLSFSKSLMKTFKVWGFLPSSRSNLANLPSSQFAFFLQSSLLEIHLNLSSKPIDKGFPDSLTAVKEKKFQKVDKFRSPHSLYSM